MLSMTPITRRVCAAGKNDALHRFFHRGTIPKSPAPNLIRGGSRLSEKLMLHVDI